MKKLITITALIAGLMFFINASAMDEHGKNHETKKTQEICPVMGNKINKSLYVDVDGKRIYVCCRGCMRRLKADPDKYIKKLVEQGVVLEEVPEIEHQDENH